MTDQKITTPLDALAREMIEKLDIMYYGTTSGTWDNSEYQYAVMVDGRTVANTGGYYSNIDTARIVRENKANAAFIAAVHNAYPDLSIMIWMAARWKAELEEARKRIIELEAEKDGDK